MESVLPASSMGRNASSLARQVAGADGHQSGAGFGVEADHTRALSEECLGCGAADVVGSTCQQHSLVR